MEKPYKINFLLVLLLFPLGIAAQFTIPKKPDVATSVYDYGKFFTNQEKKQLEQKLINYSDSTSTQIVVITVETTKGETIGLLTPRWAHEWGIGQADKDNGVLILLAKKERDIWISPGYGLEDRLTAGITGQMIREVIIPEFRVGNYYAGLDKGADALFDELKGKYNNETEVIEVEEVDAWELLRNFIVVILTLILILYVLYLFSDKKGRPAGSVTYGSMGAVHLGFSLKNFSDRLDKFNYPVGSSSGSSTMRKSTPGPKSPGSGFSGGFGGGGFSGGGAGGSW